MLMAVQQAKRSAVLLAVMTVIASGIITGTGKTASYAGGKDAPRKPRFENAGPFVRDNRTGLIWPVNGALSDETFSWGAAIDYIGSLNKERFGGARDWRLPTKEEFRSLVDFSRSLGYDGSVPERSIAAGLRTAGFSHIRETDYWTATTSLYNAADAWFVSLAGGGEGTGDKDLYLAVWPVRSGH
jgi:hypothetical protein